ncbi:hypothetical protein V6N13_142491 [Hibiscus sabdariffa]
MHITPLLSSLPSTAQFVGPRGRPPDDLPDVVMPQSHERCSSVSAVVDVAMDDSRPASCLLELQQHNGVPADGSVEWKVSYATMVARNPSNTGKSSASHTFSEDDIVVLEDDYVIAHSGKIPSIKYSTPSEFFYPNNNKTGTIKTHRSGIDNGSRLSSLMVEEDTSAREKVLSEVGPSTRDDPVLNVLGNTDSRAATHQPKATKNVAYMKSKDVARSDERMKPVQVSVDQDMIVISQDNADKSDRRTAVTLLEKKYENQGSTGGKIVKARGLTGRVQVKGHRRGFSLKKPAEVHSRPQPSLLDWMSTFSQQLDVAEISEKHGIDGIMNLSNLGDGHDPPIGGLATEHNGVHSPTVHADLGGGQETMEL